MRLRLGRRVCSSEPMLDASGLKIDGESIDWRAGKAAAASTSFSILRCSLRSVWALNHKTMKEVEEDSESSNLR